MKTLLMGVLLLALASCQGCGDPCEQTGTCQDGGTDGGDDGGVDGGCANGFCITILDSTNMLVLAEYTQQISVALGANDRLGVAYLKEDAGTDQDGGLDISYNIQYLEWQGGQRTVAPEVVQTVHNNVGVSVAFQANGQPAIAHLGGVRDLNISVGWWQNEAAVSYRSAAGAWTEQIAVRESDE